MAGKASTPETRRWLRAATASLVLVCGAARPDNPEQAARLIMRQALEQQAATPSSPPVFPDAATALPTPGTADAELRRAAERAARDRAFSGQRQEAERLRGGASRGGDQDGTSGGRYRGGEGGRGQPAEILKESGRARGGGPRGRGRSVEQPGSAGSAAPSSTAGTRPSGGGR